MARWRVMYDLEFDTVARRTLVASLIDGDLTGEEIFHHERRDYDGRPSRPSAIGHLRSVRFRFEARARLFYGRLRGRLDGPRVWGRVHLHFCPEQDQPAWNCRLAAQAGYEETAG